MPHTTDSGFPIGKVAQTLRKILYPKLTEHGVEAITVVLISHLLIESRINAVLYAWLRQDAPSPPGKPQKVSQAQNKLRKAIARMTFFQKFSLLEPFFRVDFEQAAENAKAINELRNHIFHGHEIENAKFNGLPIEKETTIEKIFVAAQSVVLDLNKFAEIIDLPHAYAERNAKCLSELERMRNRRRPSRR